MLTRQIKGGRTKTNKREGKTKGRMLRGRRTAGIKATLLDPPIRVVQMDVEGDDEVVPRVPFGSLWRSAVFECSQ